MADESEKLKIPWIPTDYIFACIDDPANAAKAAESLRTAGFHAQDVHVLNGNEFLDLMKEQCEQCDILTRFFRFIWKWGTEEGLTFSDFADEAKKGHTIVVVHVVKPEGVSEVRRILDEHMAHRIEYWGHHGTQTLLPG